MYKVMALDVGTKRIGIALSDFLLMLANGHSYIPREPEDKAIEAIYKIAKENDIIICMVNSTEEVMIRRYTLQASRILLVPENDNIPSKVCKEITIYGILTKVIRNYE